MSAMSFFVYILECSDGSYYVGHTDSLEQRIAGHQQGAIPGYTKRRLPVKLLFSQPLSTRYEALSAERQIKGWTRKKKEALIKADWVSLQELSKSYSKRDQ